MRLIGTVKGLNFDSDLKRYPLAKVRESGIDFKDNLKLSLKYLFHLRVFTLRVCASINCTSMAIPIVRYLIA